MNLTAITPILNVSDVGASIAWFERLGWKRCWTYNDGGMIAGGADSDASGPAKFAAVGSGECEIFLCRDAQGARGGKTPKFPGDDDTGAVWMTWWLKTRAEVDAAYVLAKKNGVAVATPPTDEPWGVRECRIVHPDGHHFRMSSH